MEREPILDTQALKRQRMKPLPNHERWQEYHAFFESERALELEKQLRALMEEEQQAHYKYVEMQRQKRQVLNEILHLSDELHNREGETENALDRKKELLDRINDEMDQCQFVSENAPKEIDRLNLELLDEAAYIGYLRLVSEKVRLAEIDERVQVLRQELAQLYEEKFGMQESSVNLYQCLHTLLGKEEADRLDAVFGIVTVEPSEEESQ